PPYRCSVRYSACWRRWGTRWARHDRSRTRELAPTGTAPAGPCALPGPAAELRRSARRFVVVVRGEVCRPGAGPDVAGPVACHRPDVPRGAPVRPEACMTKPQKRKTKSDEVPKDIRQRVLKDFGPELADNIYRYLLDRIPDGLANGTRPRHLRCILY